VSILSASSFSAARILVCDVGGSHISAALCHGESLILGPVATAPYPAEQSANAFVELIRTLAFHALDEEKGENISLVSGISLAFPGPFDYETGISQMDHKLAYLKGVNLRDMLASTFGCTPTSVRFINDAAGFLLGELGAGAAKGVSKVVCLTFGTGLGSAFAVDGEQLFEGHGIPHGGELWNLPYQGGILEDLLSTRGIRSAYKDRTNIDRDVAEIARSVERDTDAREAFEEFGRNLGSALRTLMPGFAPATVVMGGNISRSANLFVPAARKALGDIPFDLKVSALFDSAALYGAALQWYRKQALSV
jgi:glucokinase